MKNKFLIFVSIFALLRFAFQYNPPLQARAVVVYGSICKEIDDSSVRHLLTVFIKVQTMFVDSKLNLKASVIYNFCRILF